MLNLRAADMLCFSVRESLMCSRCWVLRQGRIGSGAVWKVNQSHLRVSPVMYCWLGFTEAPQKALLPLELEASAPFVTSREEPAHQEAFLLLRLTT